jgi:hypothetical protein
MRERDLSWAEVPIANQTGRGNRMMRSPKRALGQESGALQEPSGAPDPGGHQRLVKGHRREEAGKALGEHGFPATRWAHQQEVVCARGRDFQRAPSDGLPPNIS